LIEQGLTSPPTQYRFIWETVLQVKIPSQQYQSTEETNNTQITQKYIAHRYKKTQQIP